MNILVILPNWLGDAIMATPAIELLSQRYEDAKFTFVGSYVAIEALKYHPKCNAFYVDETKKGFFRTYNTYRFAKKLGSFDLAITFRDQLHSSLLLFFTRSKRSIAKKSWHSYLLIKSPKKRREGCHLVESYASLVSVEMPQDLKLYIDKTPFEKPTLGINAGATYGSAKRWYPQRFADVATHLSSIYDIVLFGGANEVKIVYDIEELIRQKGVTNVTNLAGRTSVKELCEKIGALELFITNDSGPMHIAAAYKVPTVAIFGPTKYKETSQWMNDKGIIVRHELECSPCMKRECPLQTHECMKGISADEVLELLHFK